VLYGGAFWIFVRSFELPGAPVLIASSFAAAYVLGYAAIFAPAGIGVREVALVLLLSPAMGAAPAAAVSVLARVWTTVVEVIPAGALWVLHVGRSLAGEGDRADAPAGAMGLRPMPPGAP
jgi:hypothetical protein